MFTKYYINFLIGLWDDWKAVDHLSVQIKDEESVTAMGRTLTNKPAPQGWSVVNIQRAFIDEGGEVWSHYFEVVNIGSSRTYGYTFSYDIGEWMWEVEHVNFAHVNRDHGAGAQNKTFMVEDCCVASWLKGLQIGVNQLPYSAPKEFPTENH